MTLIEMLITELDREGERSRRALEQLPSGKADWKPHERSMAFGYLATLVAIMPSWISMIVDQPEHDLNPPGGGGYRAGSFATSEEYIQGLQKALAGAKKSVSHTNDDHLETNWRLLVGGHVVSVQPRHVAIRDTINHWAHHRGQMTVYLRLMDAKVPALYGPSADDRTYA